MNGKAADLGKQVRATQLVMRQKWGRGTPRGLQGYRLNLLLVLLRLLNQLWALNLASGASEECLEPKLCFFEPSDRPFSGTEK
jgi:hypothetical protein